MEYERIEVNLIASILLDLNLVGKFNLNTIPLRDSFRLMLDIAQKQKAVGASHISRSLMLAEIAKLDLPIADYEVDTIYEKAEEFKMISHDSLLDEFYAAHQVLKEKQESMDLEMELAYALDLTHKGKLNEAISHVKSLNFSSKKDLPDTETLMKTSLRMTQGFKTGISKIDNELGGLLKSNLMGIIGDSGSYKTRFSLWFCLKILIKNPDFTCLYFEKEMHEKDIANMLIQNLIRIDMPTLLKYALDGGEGREFLEMEVERKLQDKDDPRIEALSRLKVVPPTMFNNAYDMFEYIDRNHPDLWVLDFLSLIFNIGGSKNTTAEAIKSLEILKTISIDTESFGMIINQINKNTAEIRNVKIPTMSDVEWGNKMKHFAAYMYSIFRPGHYYTDYNFPSMNLEMDEKDFYLIPQKGRHGNFVLPLKAETRILDFEEPDENEEKRMLQWLETYSKRRS